MTWFTISGILIWHLSSKKWHPEGKKILLAKSHYMAIWLICVDICTWFWKYHMLIIHLAICQFVLTLAPSSVIICYSTTWLVKQDWASRREVLGRGISRGSKTSWTCKRWQKMILLICFEEDAFLKVFFKETNNNSPKTTSSVCPDNESTCQEFARRGTRWLCLNWEMFKSSCRDITRYVSVLYCTLLCCTVLYCANSLEKLWSSHEKKLSQSCPQISSSLQVGLQFVPMGCPW